MAPNPIGKQTHQSVVTFTPTGGYQIVERRTTRVVLETTLDLRLEFPDAVRLPDDPAQPLPGLLGLELGPVTGSRNGVDTQPIVSQAGHRLALEFESVTASPGEYEDVITHARLRASLRTDASVQTFVIVGMLGDVTFESPDIERVEIQSFPGTYLPIGEATATGWFAEDMGYSERARRGIMTPVTFRVTRRRSDITPADVGYS